jgi:hypothetical protein
LRKPAVNRRPAQRPGARFILRFFTDAVSVSQPGGRASSVSMQGRRPERRPRVRRPRRGSSGSGTTTASGAGVPRSRTGPCLPRKSDWRSARPRFPARPVSRPEVPRAFCVRPRARRSKRPPGLTMTCRPQCAVASGEHETAAQAEVSVSRGQHARARVAGAEHGQIRGEVHLVNFVHVENAVLARPGIGREDEAGIRVVFLVYDTVCGDVEDAGFRGFPLEPAFRGPAAAIRLSACAARDRRDFPFRPAQADQRPASGIRCCLLFLGIGIGGGSAAAGQHRGRDGHENEEPDSDGWSPCPGAHADRGGVRGEMSPATDAAGFASGGLPVPRLRG